MPIVDWKMRLCLMLVEKSKKKEENLSMYHSKNIIT